MKGKKTNKTQFQLVKVYNLGSPNGSLLNFNRKELWARMDAVMSKKALSIPIFLVNENQMDKLYPPEKRHALDPEKVRGWVKERKRMREEREWDLENPLEGIDRGNEETWERYKKFIAVGLYMNFNSRVNTNLAYSVIELGDDKYQSEESVNSFGNLKGPAIFICPERVIDWANSKNFSLELVLDKVYYHELGHAILDKGNFPYNETWARVIEESLANSIAFNKFKGHEAHLVQLLIEDQPAEYQGYAWISTLSQIRLIHKLYPDVLYDLLRFYRHVFRDLYYRYRYFFFWALIGGIVGLSPLPFIWTEYKMHYIGNDKIEFVLKNLSVLLIEMTFG